MAARRQNAVAAIERIHDAITQLHREHALITTAGVARRACVSRTFLYTNSEAKAAVEEGKRTAGTGVRRPMVDPHESTWRERALNAESALKSAHDEIVVQRRRIGELLGQIRDIESEWTEGTIQRVTHENTNLKQRVRNLSDQNRTLDERLSAARTNLRFQDRRLSELEAS